MGSTSLVPNSSDTLLLLFCSIKEVSMCDNRLREILSPPKNPRESPSKADWKIVESKWCVLPTDFKSFVTEYGTGSIDGFIWIFNPASRNPNLDLVQQISRQIEALRGSTSVGLTAFPQSGGILPFGLTDNGDLLAWKVQGIPDSWGIVVVDSRAPSYEKFDRGFSDFLVGILRKKIVCTIFPDDFPSSSPKFSSG
jgi:SMI1-KNR4 cell-wall